MFNDVWGRVRSAALMAFARAQEILPSKRVVSPPNPPRTYDPMGRTRRVIRKVSHKCRTSTYFENRTQIQEMARRRRQIERGQLTASNGFVTPGLYIVSPQWEHSHQPSVRPTHS